MPVEFLSDEQAARVRVLRRGIRSGRIWSGSSISMTPTGT